MFARKTRFWGWGYEDVVYNRTTAQHLLNALVQQFDLPELPPKRAALPLDQHALPETKLPRDFIDRWSNKGLSLDRLDRVSHATGKSYRDLLRVRSANLERYPDGVLFLQNGGDLRFLFEDASKSEITLIPFGGGTGVVGGTECVGPSGRPILVVDLKELNRLLSLDDISLTATFQAGILGPHLEKLLNEKGYTLGHFPQSFEFSTLGGWVATRSAGQNSTKYGRIDERVVALKIQTPKGPIEMRPLPASATGPSLKEVFMGSEGIYGIITEVTVRISELPRSQRFVAAFFKDFGTGIDAVRHLLQGGLQPSILRLSDEAETSLFRQMQPLSPLKERAFSLWLRLKDLGPSPSLLLLTAEGSIRETERQEMLIRQSLKRDGAVCLSKSQSQTIGSHWLQNRFALPYLRDDLMDHTFFTDTLETATEWSQLHKLHAEMIKGFTKRKDETGESMLIGCHLSHAYDDGASLYFTLIGPQRKNDELRQWEEVKRLATDILMANGGTLSHHHGVGYDHRPWMKQEKTELGVEVLRQIKTQLDPDHLLNPEKTI